MMVKTLSHKWVHRDLSISFGNLWFDAFEMAYIRYATSSFNTEAERWQEIQVGIIPFDVGSFPVFWSGIKRFFFISRRIRRVRSSEWALIKNDFYRDCKIWGLVLTYSVLHKSAMLSKLGSRHGLMRIVKLGGFRAQSEIKFISYELCTFPSFAFLCSLALWTPHIVCIFIRTVGRELEQ